MSQTVDNRIVQMQFDNAQFEKGVAETTKSLNNLKESLDLQNSVKGVDEISNRFSAMEVAVVTTIAKITSAVEDMAISLAKSLTIDQVTAGFSKYEQELKAVQVMLNSSTDSIEVVTEAMRRLSWYTDETSYSYGSMADAIAKFTAQGIDTTSAETALEGIANMAGLAGASVTDASHAMEGFAKAMAQGKMTQINWSWIRTAHMNTQQIKQVFLEAAENAGTLRKEADGVWKDLKGNTVTLQTFETTMKDGWMNAKAMNTAFVEMGSYSDMLHDFIDIYNDMTDSEIGATEAMEILNGDLSENKSAVVAYGKAQGLLADEIDETTISTEELVKVEQDATKWTESLSRIGFEAGQQYRTFSDAIEATKDAASTQFKEIFSNLFGNVEEAGELWGSLGTAMNEFFVGDLYEYADIFKEFHDQFKGFELVLDLVKNALSNLKAMIEPFSTAMENLFPKPTAQAIADACVQLNGFIKALGISQDAGEGLTNTLTTLGKPIKFIAETVGFLIKLLGAAIIIANALVQKFFAMFSSTDKLYSAMRKVFGDENTLRLINSFHKAIANLKEQFDLIKESFSKLLSKLPQLKATSNIISAITTAITGLTNIIANGLIWALERLAEIDLSGFFQTFEDLLDGKITLVDVGTNIINGLIEGLKNGLSTLVKAATSVGTVIVETIKNVLGIASPSKVAIAIGGFLVAGLVIGISKSDTELGKAISSITQPFLDFFKTLDMGKIVIGAFCGVFAAAVSSVIFQVGRLIGAFSNVLNGFAKIENGLAKIEKGIGTYIANLGKAQKWNAMANTMKYVAISLGILAAAMIAFSFIPEDGLKRAGNAIAQLAAVIALLGLALTAISKLQDPAPILTKEEAVADGIQSFLKKMGNSSMIAAFGVAVTMLGSAFLKLAIAIKILDGCDNGIAIAAVVMVGLIGVISLFALVMKETEKKKLSTESAKFGVAMLAMAAAIGLLLVPIKLLAGTPATDFIAGAAFIVGAMGLFVVFAKLLKYSNLMSSDIHKFGLAMLEMAVAVDLMLIPILALKKVPLSDITSGLVFVGGAMALFTIFAAVATLTYTIDKDIKQLSKCMLAMAVAIDLMLIPILVLSNSGIEVTPGVVFILGVSMLFKYFLDMATSVNQKGEILANFSKCMISMAAAIDLMMVPILIFKGWTLGDIAPGLAVIVTIAALFAGFMKLAQSTSEMSKDLKEFGICVALMSVAVVSIGTMIGLLSLLPNPLSVMASAASIGVVIALLAQAVTSMTKVGKKDEMIAAAASLAGLIVCLNALIPVYLVISKLSWEELATAMVGIIVPFGAIFSALFFLNKTVSTNAKGTPDASVYTKIAESIAVISASMLMIAGSIAVLANFDCDKVAVSGAMIFANFGAIAAALMLLNKNANVTAKGNVTTTAYKNIAKVIVELAASMLIISGAIAICAQFDPGKVAASGALLIAAYVAIAGSLVLLNKAFSGKVDVTSMAAISGAILVLSGSMLLIAASLNKIASYDFNALGGAAVALAGTLAVITVALYALSTVGPVAIAAAAAIGIVAAAIGIIAQALVAVVSIDPNSITAFFGAIAESSAYAGQIALMGAALAALGAGLLIMAPGVLLIGVGLLAATPAILAFTSALTALSLISAEGSENISAVLDMLISKIPILALAIGEGIVALINALAEAAPAIMTIVQTIMTGIITALSENAVTIANAVITILDAILAKVTEWAPKLIICAQQVIALLCQGLLALAPLLITTGTLLIVQLITGIGAAANIILEAAADTIINFINGLADTIETHAEDIKEAGRNLIGSLITAITGSEALGDMVEAGLAAVDGFIAGIGDGIAAVGEKGLELGGALLDKVKGILGIHSPSRVLREYGHLADVGLEEGLESGLVSVEQAANLVGEEALEGVDSGINEDGGLFNLGEGGIIGFVKGIKSKIDDVKASGGSVKDALINELVGAVTQSGILGGEAGDAFAEMFLGSATKKAYGADELVYDITSGNFRKAITEGSSLDDIMSQLSESTASAGSSSKSTAKSIEELAQTYHYGEDAIKQFAVSYGETMLKIKYGTDDATVQAVAAFKSGLKEIKADIDMTADDAESTVKVATADMKNNIADALTNNNDVMALSEKAIDNLALHLYSISDYYKEDLNNAELNTETSLKHIQAAFSEAFAGIQSSLDSVDWFTAADDDGAEDDIDKIKENMQSQLDLQNEYLELQKQIQQMDLTDALKQKALQTGVDDISFLRMLVNSDQSDLDELGSLYDEAQTVTQTGAAQVAAAAAAGLVDMKNTIGTGASECATEFVNGMTTTLDSAIQNGTLDQRVMTMAQNSITAMREAWGIHSPSTVTAELMQNFILGMMNEADVWTTPLYEKGKSLAARICEGLEMGLREGKSGVINAAIEVMRAGIDAAEDTAGINSPSKVFEKMGYFMDMGLAQGILKYSSSVEEASGKLTDATINRVNSSISRINEFVDGEITNPTITPVLDLSQVKAGASQLDGMFENARLSAEAIQNGNGLDGTRNVYITSPVYLDGKFMTQYVNTKLGVQL